MPEIELVFAPMVESDLDEVVDMEIVCFPTPWSRALFVEEMARKDTCRWITARNSQGLLVGYMGWWKIVDEAHVTNLAVEPGFRRKGVGAALVEKVLADAKLEGCVRATLEVRPSNEAAVKLYESFGFKPAAMRPGYYTDNGEAALLMWKTDMDKI